MRIIVSIALILFLLFFPEISIQAAENALRTWGGIVPSLFPYMVFCKMLAAQISQTCFPAAITVVLLGLLGGSPSGAIIISEYAAKGRLTRSGIHALTALTGIVSPMFLLNTIKPWLNDGFLCRRVFLCSEIGACVASIIVRIWTKPRTKEYFSIKEANERASNPIVQSIHSILNVGGCIVVFSVVASSLHILPFANAELLQAGAHAILEISGGIHALSCSNLSPVLFEYVLIAFAAFGGLSIMAQNLLFLCTYEIRYVHLIIYGVLRAAIACAAKWLLF